MRRIVIASILLVVALVVAARPAIVPASKSGPQGGATPRPRTHLPDDSHSVSQERLPRLGSTVDFTARHLPD